MNLWSERNPTNFSFIFFNRSSELKNILKQKSSEHVRNFNVRNHMNKFIFFFIFKMSFAVHARENHYATVWLVK